MHLHTLVCARKQQGPWCCWSLCAYPVSATRTSPHSPIQNELAVIALDSKDCRDGVAKHLCPQHPSKAEPESFIVSGFAIFLAPTDKANSTTWILLTICSSCSTPGSSVPASIPTTSTSSRCSSSCSSVPRVAAAPGPPPAAAKRSDSQARRTQLSATVTAVPACAVQGWRTGCHSKQHRSTAFDGNGCVGSICLVKYCFQWQALST